MATVIENEVTKIIEVAGGTGPQGPKGNTGDQGIQGIPGVQSRTVVYTQTNKVTVNQANVETSITGTGIGTKTFPANNAEIGEVLVIKYTGKIYTDNTDTTLNLRFKLNGVVNYTVTNTLEKGLTGNKFEVEFRVLVANIVGTVATTYNSFGTLVWGSKTSAVNMTGRGDLQDGQFDPTVQNTVDITYQLSRVNGSNYIVVEGTTIEMLNPNNQ